MKVIGNHKLKTKHAQFQIVGFKDDSDNEILVIHSIKDADLLSLRIQFGCLYSTVFDSVECDCKNQVERFLKIIAQTEGLLIYMPGYEAHGLGLHQKMIISMELENETGQFDPIGVDHDFSFLKKIINHFKLSSKTIQFYTNNPNKTKAISSLLKVAEVIRM